MLNFPRLQYLDASRRGAIALAALLVVVLIATTAGALRIYQALGQAGQIQQQLIAAEGQVSQLLRAQSDEDVGVRGFLETRREFFLGKQRSAEDDFERTAISLDRTAQELGYSDVIAAARSMASDHRRWEATTDEPLAGQTIAPDVARNLEATGKMLSDKIDGEAQSVLRVLDAHVRNEQRALVWRINETLAIAVLSILLFGIVGIIFVGSRYRMAVRLDRERRIIETLQRAFQTGWDPIPHSRIGTAYVSATRDAAVGGDLFDIRRLDDDRGLIVMADMSGKGIDAAVNTAFVKYSLRTLAVRDDDPAAILNDFNRMFLDTIKDPSLFVVAFVGIFDSRTMSMTYASAGHSGAYLRRGRDVTQLEVTGPIVGLDREFEYASGTVTFLPQDMLVLATDGLTEARDRHGAALDDAGAIALVRESPSDPQACADRLVSAVRRRSGGRIVDDLALLVITIDESTPKAGARSADAAA